MSEQDPQSHDPQRADIERFVARNHARLMPLYDYSRTGGLPFCWPGLLFPQAWFFYRKMYLWAALVTAGPLLLTLIPGLAWLDWGASILGALGLKIYFAEAERTLARIRERGGDEALIRRAGGVSIVGGAVGLAFTFAVFVMSLKGGVVSMLRAG